MSEAITRPRLLIGAVALVCVLAVPLAASWGDTRATDSAGVSKKRFKKLKKRVKALEQQGQQPGSQGPPGEQGEPGQPGQDATKLFAYIGDNGTANAATVQYGSGVTGVTDPAGAGTYMVTFDRSLENCVVEAVAGTGDPPGTNQIANSFPVVFVNGVGPGVDLQFFNAADFMTDTSFMITAFC